VARRDRVCMFDIIVCECSLGQEWKQEVEVPCPLQIRAASYDKFTSAFSLTDSPGNLSHFLDTSRTLLNMATKSVLSSVYHSTRVYGSTLTANKVFRSSLRPRHNPLLSPRFSALQTRLLSSETRAAIDKAVASAPVVLFMKGTPEMPQCGFSRASIQVLGLQGVDPQKFTAFNVLEDEELRSGASTIRLLRISCSEFLHWTLTRLSHRRHQRVLGMADHTPALH